MQSSPPMRAWRPTESAAESQYSINLAALDMDTRSDSSSGVPKRKVERIFSEDIDGPSDFTQNMEHWLRGGTTSKPGTLKCVRNAPEAIAEGSEHAGEQDVDGPVLEQPDEEQQDEVPEADEDLTMSHHTPSGTPPRISISQRSNVDGGFSSEWDGYGITSTPYPQLQRKFLQPTVDDHHSELTPARATSRNQHILYSSAHEALQRSLMSNANRSPHMPEMAAQLKASTTSAGTAADQERDTLLVKPWEAKCRQLEHFNDAIQQTLDEERRSRNQESLSHASELAEAERRHQQLVGFNAACQGELDDVRRENAQLRKKLAEQESAHRRTASAQSFVTLREGDRTLLVHEEIRRQVAAQAQEIDTLRRNLQLARQTQKDSEETAQGLREQLDGHREMHEAEMGRLNLEVQNAREDESAISRLEQQLREARIEIERLRADKSSAEDEAKQKESELSKIQENHAVEFARHVADRTRAVELASTFQQQLQDLRKQLSDAQSLHENDLASMTASPGPTPNDRDADFEILRRELDSTTAALNAAIFDRDRASDDLSAVQSQLDDARAALEDLRAVTAAVDAQLQDAVRKRERAWQKHLAKVDADRAVMAKALLHGWGREECGVHEPQLYAYMYSKGGQGLGAIA